MGKKNFFAQGKYRVRWKNNAVFSLEKTVLNRIPLYKRTVLKEECLYHKTNPIDGCHNNEQRIFSISMKMIFSKMHISATS